MLRSMSGLSFPRLGMPVFFAGMLLCRLPLHAQSYAQELQSYRTSLVESLTQGPDAPLWPGDTSGLRYFDLNEAYRVKAGIELLKVEKPFKMPTYAGTTREFIRHARLHFEVNGRKASLTAYRDLSVPGPLAAFHRTLFIPFMDETNDDETYGGGRYIDLPLPAEEQREIVLDFNKAYNPYCAYSDGYRCPVPPEENHLPFKILAGEQRYTGEKRMRGVRGQSPMRFSGEEHGLTMSGDTAAMLRVIQVTEPSELKILRTASADLDPADPLLPVLARRMYLSVNDPLHPGVGIAAPQVGINRNLIWVKRYDKEGEPFELYINPRITWRSALLRKGLEGCLSIPDIRDDVYRHYTIRLNYLDRDGVAREELIEGFTAVIFQHETDHLNGILFTDHLEKQKGIKYHQVNPETGLYLERLPSRP